MYLIFSCALVSPNSKSITFWWEIKVEVSGREGGRGGFENGLPRDRGVHGVVLKTHLHCQFRITLHQIFRFP